MKTNPTRIAKIINNREEAEAAKTNLLLISATAIAPSINIRTITIALDNDSPIPKNWVKSSEDVCGANDFNTALVRKIAPNINRRAAVITP